MNPVSQYVVDRLREPSSHAGFAAIFQGLKYIFPEYALAFDIASMVLGSAAVVKAG